MARHYQLKFQISHFDSFYDTYAFNNNQRYQLF